MKKGTGFLTLFGGAVALYALLAAPVSMRAQETETIEDGVYIGNIYVGGRPGVGVAAQPLDDVDLGERRFGGDDIEDRR